MKDLNFSIHNQILEQLKGKIDDYYLAGGTALSMAYFHHRESYDLDFFTQNFSLNRVVKIVDDLKKNLKVEIETISEQISNQTVRMAVYLLKFPKGSQCKIDLVEDFIELMRDTNVFNGVRILSLEDIYLRKIYAVAGTIKAKSIIGEDIMIGGRQEAKDFYDLYCLSTISTPLASFVKNNCNNAVKEGLIYWYKTYDRMNIKTGLVDLITPKKIDYRIIDEHFNLEINNILEMEISGE